MAARSVSWTLWPGRAAAVTSRGALVAAAQPVAQHIAATAAAAVHERAMSSACTRYSPQKNLQSSLVGSALSIRLTTFLTVETAVSTRWSSAPNGSLAIS